MNTSENTQGVKPSEYKRPVPTLRGILKQTRLRAREGELAVTRQLFEMVVLRTFYGIGPGYYHTARFWRKDLPWTFKTGSWPYKKFRRIVNNINPPAYQKMSQDKVCEKAILQMVGIPTPRFIGSLHQQRGLSPDGKSLTNSDELGRLLESVAVGKKICFKLVEGFGGQGFQAVEVIRDSDLRLRLLGTGQIITVSEFADEALGINQGGAYIIEDYIEQHPALSNLNPSSVNTIRVWAACTGEGNVVIDAFLRVGGQGSLVDNTSRGAHIFRMDMGSGIIGDGMIKNITNDTFQCHRDSGKRISGLELPFWQESLELAKKAVSAFPHINFAGVDVAVSNKGPVVVELNVEPDPTSAIIFDRSHRELFVHFGSILSSAN